ncbi:hypothetical protein LZ32DRAFT_310824 [Colletotrichum eremochloae]|nr:hypothetical protein LZ32DRAFT_310824 [Colletotrichum eremochloae]
MAWSLAVAANRGRGPRLAQTRWPLRPANSALVPFLEKPHEAELLRTEELIHDSRQVPSEKAHVSFSSSFGFSFSFNAAAAVRYLEWNDASSSCAEAGGCISTSQATTDDRASLHEFGGLHYLPRYLAPRLQMRRRDAHWNGAGSLMKQREGFGHAQNPPTSPSPPHAYPYPHPRTQTQQGQRGYCIKQ